MKSLLVASQRNQWRHLFTTSNPCKLLSPWRIPTIEERLRLQDSLARVGELTAGIAHKFRNGLATIHGYSRLLDPQELQTEYKAYVEGIREETVALREVVDNFLNFARPAELSLGKVSLRKLIDRAAEEIRKDARASGGDVYVRGEFPDVEGDEVLLRQALSNLCRNAIDACLGGDDAPRIVLEGTIDLEHWRGADHHHRQRSRHRPGAARQDFSPLLHDQDRRDWARARLDPEDYRDP